MGRPLKYPERKLLLLTTEQAKRVADYRFEARIDSESEAIRQLIDLGLEAAKEAGAKTPEK